MTMKIYNFCIINWKNIETGENLVLQNQFIISNNCEQKIFKNA